MKLTFWGVRGSIPIPGAETARYGGNTPCLEIEGSGGECILFEAGSGLRVLGQDLMKRGTSLPAVNLFISHTHWDHIQGFPFFTPCYIPGTKITIRGPVHYMEKKTLQDIFANQMEHEFFPVSNQQLAADIAYEDLSETELEIGGVKIRSQYMNHSIRSLGYRLEEAGRTLVYTGDHEPYYNMFADADGDAHEDDLLFEGVDDTVDQAVKRFIGFVDQADVFVVDCQYTPDEYPSLKKAWGHSSWDYCLDWMQQAGAGRMILTHHDPLRTDEALDAIFQDVQRAAREKGIDPDAIMIAREGMEVTI